MENSCPKCGAPRQSSDAECANCGIVYAKLAKGAITRPGGAALPSGRKISPGMILFIALAAVAIVFPKLHAATRQPTTSSPTVLSPLAGTATTSPQADNTDAYGIETTRSAAKIMAQYQQWEDGVAVARNISRDSLASIVTNLQAIRRNTTAIAVQPCLAPAKQALLDSMGREIDGFLLLMRTDATTADTGADTYFEDARRAADVYEKRIHECSTA